MAKPLQKQVGKLSIMDAFLIAGSKQLEERFLTPFIGNGTLLSGAVKMGAGIASNQWISGKFGDIAGTAFIVDGAEDILNFALPQLQTQSAGSAFSSSPSSSGRKERKVL